jgi:hypothetical protein
MGNWASFTDSDSFRHFVAVFVDHLDDEFVIGHEMGRLLSIEENIHSVKGEYGKHMGIGREIKLSKKKGSAIQLLLTSKRLLIAYHRGESWGGLANREVDRVESLWIGQGDRKLPSLCGIKIERGPLLGSSARIVLQVKERENSFPRLIGAMVNDRWLPGILKEVL